MPRINRPFGILSLAIACACVAPVAAQTLLENFDEPGADLANTLFPSTQTSHGNIWTRDSGQGIQGIPQNGILPISTGGDNELRYSEQSSIDQTTSLAFTSPEYQSMNGWIDGYVDFSRPVTAGSMIGGLALRVADPNDYFSAQIEVVGNRGAQFTLRQFSNGTGGAPLASLTIGATDFSSENYRIHLEANGNTISASLWRVVPGQNALSEPFIGNLFAP